MVVFIDLRRRKEPVLWLWACEHPVTCCVLCVTLAQAPTPHDRCEQRCSLSVKSFNMSGSLRTGIEGTCVGADSSQEGIAQFPAQAERQSGGCCHAVGGYFCPARHMPYILQSMDGTAGFSQLGSFGSCLLKCIYDSLFSLNHAVGEGLLQQPWCSQIHWNRDGAESWGSARGWNWAPGSPHSSLPCSCWEQGLLCLSWVCTDKRGILLVENA